MVEIASTEELSGYKIRCTATLDGQVVGRAFLFLITNDLHDEPYGLLEDVYVDEAARGQGIGKALVAAVISEAQEKGCYKLITQSRHGKDLVHAMYEKCGFRDHGKNFRMDFS